MDRPQAAQRAESDVTRCAGRQPVDMDRAATTYRVSNWLEDFENNRTRTMKAMRWVPIPNSHDGDEYTWLVDHADGAGHFACWIAALQIASRCEPRGTLVRANDEPHDAASLARVSRLPAPLWESALPRLVRVGLLSAQPVVAQEVAPRRQEGAGFAQAPGTQLTKKEGIEGREGKERKEPGLLPPGAPAPAGAAACGRALASPSDKVPNGKTAPLEALISAWNEGRGHLPAVIAPPASGRQRLLRTAWKTLLTATDGHDAAAADLWAAAVRRAAADPFYVERGYGIDTLCRHLDRFLDEQSARRDGAGQRVITSEDWTRMAGQLELEGK